MRDLMDLLLLISTWARTLLSETALAAKSDNLLTTS
jgi:hypothetical protein